MPAQNILKQHDRRLTDVKTLIAQQTLLKGTMMNYQDQARKQYKKYEEWCGAHKIKPEEVVLPKVENIII